jgi:monoterpene epsilon-lactone hydrolase
MTISPTERKVRAILPIIRFLQTYIPLSLARFLLKIGMKRVHLAADIIRESVSADGVPCEWIIPRDSLLDQVLLYLHGGGFVFGLTPLHLQMCAYLAKNIVVAGDSAGGNLSITTLMKARDSGNPLPAAVACLSPVTDFTSEDSLRKGFKDPLIPPKAAKLYSQSYVGHSDASDPLISPVFGNLRGLPPLLVHVGEDEILLDDAKRITNVAKSADVDVRLEIYSRMWHVWQLYLSLPQAVQSLDDIAQFLQSHLGQGK